MPVAQLLSLKSLSVHGSRQCLRAFATYPNQNRPLRPGTSPGRTGQYSKPQEKPATKPPRPASPAFNNGIKDVLRRVPKTREVFLVERSSGEPKKVSLNAIRLQPGESVRILNELAPKAEGLDPQVFVRVEGAGKPAKERTSMSKEDAKREKKEKKDKQKGPEQRQIQLSWGISKHDIGHKARVVDAFFAKGDTVMVTIKPSRSQQYQSVDGLVLESRQQTLKLVKEMLEANGKELKPPVGSYNGSFVLVYKPSATSSAS